MDDARRAVATCPARKELEDWLRSSLYGLTGKCWELSYTNRNGQSQNKVVFAFCGDIEIAFRDGEPETHDFLKQRISECILVQG